MMNTTTHEYFSKTWTRPNYNPFDVGFFMNLISIIKGSKKNDKLVFPKGCSSDVAPELFKAGNAEFKHSQESSSLNKTGILQKA
jgi:hypothetical protein